MNRNAYVVVTWSYGLGHDKETDIVKVFGSEEKAKAWIDGCVTDWLKNQSIFDPEHKFSGTVEYEKNSSAPYVMLDVLYDKEGTYERYFAYDIEIYDLED